MVSAIVGTVVGVALGVALSYVRSRVGRPTLLVNQQFQQEEYSSVDSASLKPIEVVGECVGDCIGSAVFYYLPLMCQGRREARECHLPELFVRGNYGSLVAKGVTFWSGFPEAPRTVWSGVPAKFCVFMLDKGLCRVRLWEDTRNRWEVIPEDQLIIAIRPDAATDVRIKGLELALRVSDVEEECSIEVLSVEELVLR